jgi:hypothetical protein
MKVAQRVGRIATLIVLALAAAPLGAEGRQFVCWPIVRGDTAISVARRLTGNAAAAYSEWFQIRDPARRIFVPKSHYERLSTSWQACVPRELVREAAVRRVSDGRLQGSSPYDVTLAWQVGLAVSLLLLTGSMVFRSMTDRPIPPAMQEAGEQFVRAFAQPLIDPSSGTAPIRARLRFVRRAGQLEICLAPQAGRRYPNLLDHKQNVEYDVNRVVQLLSMDVVVSDRLRAEGPWVVVPLRRVDLKQAGVK